ncbi:MAG: Ig-like domain-containing protein, partial [Patescibacteria group bacterium]
MSKKIKLSLLFLSLFIFIVAANSVLAADFGVNQVSNTIALSQGDPRVIIGRIIQIILSFLGVIALVLIMYAGFLWMTSGGEEEKVSQAKKILSSAIIGLVIILSSWAIATFLLNKISQATGGGTNTPGSTNNGNFSSQGAGAVGACSVETYYPSDGQKDVPRNSSILFTFKEELKLNSVCSDGSGAACACNKTTCNKINPEAIRIFKKDLGDACSKGICLKPNSNITDVIVNVTDSNKTLILSPVVPLGLPSANSEYSVKFSSQLKKLDGNSMFKTCAVDFLEYSFTVSTNLDLTPPHVSLNGIFPLPDNSIDVRTEVPGKQALSVISLSGSICPRVYTPAKLISVTPSGPEVTAIFEKTIKKFKLSVPASASDKLELFDGETNQALGIASFDSSGIVVFPGRLSLKIASHNAGDLWTVIIEPEIFPDTLTIGQDQYTFVSETDSRAKSANYIVVPATCSLDVLTTNIQAKLSGNANIIVNRVSSANILNLSARSAGTAGNDLIINSTAAALRITPFTGGVNAEEKYIPQDKPDRPMNSALQINFNEPINPVTVSGSADEVFNYIRIVNARATS